jgi:transposase
MYLRKTTRTYKEKTYTNHLLVESVHTPKGPRQRIICSWGSLEPAPPESWLGLAHKLEAALQGQGALPGASAPIGELAATARRGTRPPRGGRASAAMEVDANRVAMEESREAGPVHVGHQLWQQLRIEPILRRAGLSARACVLTEAMTLNRLIAPLSEHAMPDWMRRTALSDILPTDFSALHDDALYRNLDRLHPKREQIERELAAQEKTLFNLEDTVYLYDLTSTYFEGHARRNPQAKRGDSRDQRPDCKQVVVGLVLDRHGFPKAHEVFDGNVQDRRTLATMLDALEKRVGTQAGATVIVDRGMAYAENLDQIRQRGLHYLVAGLQPERTAWLQEFENDEGWEDVVRVPSPRNPAQTKTRVQIKRRSQGDVAYLLCRSDGRTAKDRAIRDKHEGHWLSDVQKLQRRVATGRLKAEAKIQQAIGRLRERYPRVARYYAVAYDAERRQVVSQVHDDKKVVATKLDGSYLLKTDRHDLPAEDIWRTYILLTRVENAFRAMKSPLMERPIFHHLEHRTQTHIFLCVLAYHLLTAIEHRCLQAGIHTSWWTLRQQLSTHRVATIVLPTPTGPVLKIRKATTPAPVHRDIYATLRIPAEVMKPVKTWHPPDQSDDNTP